MVIVVENNLCTDYTIEKIIKRFYVDELIENCLDTVRVMSYCKECKNYNNVWSCPPFNFNTLEIVNKYEYIYIIAYKLFLKKSIYNGNYDKINNTIVNIRKNEEPNLLLIENKYKNTYALYAGSCILCEDCIRKYNKECLYKEHMRYSLESLGFDVQKISKDFLNIEIKWALDGKVPEYFTLISGILSNSTIDELDGVYKR